MAVMIVMTVTVTTVVMAVCTYLAMVMGAMVAMVVRSMQGGWDGFSHRTKPERRKRLRPRLTVYWEWRWARPGGRERG
jgi:hypothetical protein